MSASAITITGNLTSDPELKVFESGSKASFGVAVNYYWNDQKGERQEKTSFFNVVAWKQLADDAAEVLTKGMRVVVSGRLEQRSYQDKDGNNRSVVEITAEDIGASVRGIVGVQRKEYNGNGNGRSQGAARPKAAAATASSRRTVVEDDEPF
ncbi:MAG: single-stranded DNA-binding protein [Ilumatobacteraceae bacterium]|jgi:single-strand DNA-binding protein